ncbi:MAG: hypothetical protein M1840_008709 [Geoglossum simile]|nr:MAG: hypothetical protein M1840_008709 [Geoglossum simile]
MAIVKRHRSIEAAEVYNQNDKRLKKSSPHSPLPANKSFEGHPAVSPESKSKSTLMSYSGARDGGHQGGRIRDTVGDSVTGGRLQRTESASEGLGKGPRLQSHSLQQEISAPNASKDNSKNNQREYRCPQCSFPCWLCNTSEVPGLESESSSEEESGQPETMDMNTLSRSTSKRKRTDGLTYLGPREERFRDFVLGPCGVRIKEGVLYLQPGEIPGDGIQDDPTVTSRVRLEINDTTANETSVQFLCYDQRKYDETTLTKLVTHYLAPFECYINADGPQTVVSLCKDKWRPRKEGPPVPPLHGATYDWDIEPDITYMVALNLFEKDLRDTMQWSELYWLLAEPLGVCPYLTFELKCAEKSGKNSDVNCQISAASVLWLYQRKKLKDVLKSSDLSDLRHYSIVINSMAFQIWVTVFDGRFYSVQMIDRGSFERPEGVKRYAEWSNAIHKWGLGPNARSFKRDVEVLWKSMSH